MKSKFLFHTICVLAFLAGMISVPSVGHAAPDAGSISGTTTYDGSYDPNHEVLVAAHLSVDASPVASVHLPGLGDYTLEDLPDGSYYISAFLDIHDRGEGPPEFGEPAGWYDSNGDDTPDQVTVSGGSLTGIDIAMADITSEYIQGTVCYLGGVHGPGPMQVGLHVNPADGPVVVQDVSLPCDDYIFNGGPEGTYYASLFYDVNASGGPPDPGEPNGWYDADADGNPDPIIYTGNVITDVNITLGRIHYVDFSAAGSGTGASWQDAYPDLQQAFAAAAPGEEIWVAAGIYTPGATRDASFVLSSGVAIYGGFNGSERFRNERNWAANITILSGEIGSPDTRADNIYHIVTTASTLADPVDETAILDGFTITGGQADGWEAHQDKGGGLLNDYGNPTLVNLNFIGNYAENHGGAIANQYPGSPLAVIHSTFSGNSTLHNAGAIANLGASSIIVVNSSIVGNQGGNGGGIVNLQGSHADIYNSILWDNQGSEIGLQDTSTAAVSYSIVEGGYTGGSHILTSDPQFVDAKGLDNLYGTLDDDLHLQGASPAIDAGDNAAQLTDLADSDGDSNFTETPPFDIDGTSRLIDDLAAPNTGSGTAPIIDIGPDEYASPVAISGLMVATNSPTLLGEPTLLSARLTSGTHLSYAWDFGDGSSDSQGVTSHTYSAAGVYPVDLAVSNSLGSQQASETITVYETLPILPGASAATSDGRLTIEIPASITSTVTITYTPQAGVSQPLGNFELAGLAFELQAAAGDGPPILVPGVPFTLTVHYDEGGLPAGTDEVALELTRFDDNTGQWVVLPVVDRDPVNNTLTVSLDHFSAYALVVEEPEAAEKFIYLPMVMK